MDTEALNKCLRSELAAVETYRQALDRDRAEFGHYAGFQELSAILDDHQNSVKALGELVAKSGGAPATDAGAWGTWSKAVMGAAKLLGDKAALKALKEGEESGLKQYRAVTEDHETPSTVKVTLSALSARQQHHILTLDRMMDAA